MINSSCNMQDIGTRERELAMNTMPSISVDCVIFGFDFKKLSVLLLERKLVVNNGATTFTDYTLIGNHIKSDESLDEAATRILLKTTGLSNIYLEQFYTFGSTNRLVKERDKKWLSYCGKDPDKRVISVAYYSLVHKGKVQVVNTIRNAKWFALNEIGELAFDHQTILMEALNALKLKLKTAPLAFELLPQKFTLSQLQKLYEIVYDIKIDKRNFRKKVQFIDYIVPLNEKQKDVGHKPAQYFMFSRDIYEATKTDDTNLKLY